MLTRLTQIFGEKKEDKAQAARFFEPAMDKGFKPVFETARKYTMTLPERMYNLYLATQYVASRGIPGDLVECGVWKGGSAMAMALTLLGMGDKSRTIYLYDTFEGMSRPSEKDVDYYGNTGEAIWVPELKEDHNAWAYCPLEEARRNLVSTGYPEDKLKFVKGRAEETLAHTVPEKIAILRLDTDWYESTYQELVYLFPKLSPGGVLLVDDYGHWKGSKEAVDRYFKEKNVQMLLQRIDYAARMGVKA
ncbi:MAG: class I SAM-dependent methyltransferase [Candidatus Omnitrophica bacterium]|nr:class I SAM-dependent methyltransferase [Candidatus Omnitrophota bacterium]